jgi:hypothetical protein
MKPQERKTRQDELGDGMGGAGKRHEARSPAFPIGRDGCG